MLFTCEQVSDGHPDKICDQISDAVVSECLRQDKTSRVAIETLIKDYNIVIAGELTTNANLNIEKLVQEVLQKIGLENIDKYIITKYISKQSSDIAKGVNIGGAGDQGMMFGYATNETKEMLPIPFVLATKVLLKLKDLRKQDKRFKADAKSQVTYDYETNKIVTFLISTQHSEDLNLEELNKILSNLMIETATEYNLNTDFNILTNPAGTFIIGSSFADSGVTGRKIIADTYGSACPHGGGAFSGKDPSKVDRSGAYICRLMAKDIVENKYADKCEIQISYAIGKKEPLSLSINCFNTSKKDEKELINYLNNKYDLTPNGIINRLDLLNTNFNETSSYGHFGKENLPWEKVN